MSTKYAVLRRTSPLQYVVPVEELELATKGMQNYTVPAGTLIKIASEQSVDPTTVLVFVYDSVLREPNTTRLYQCKRNCLLPVSDELWPFIVSIPEPLRRLQLLKDEGRCNWLNTLKRGSFVSVSGRHFNGADATIYDCIVRYMGPVPEVHPVGYFFGLELVCDELSPQIGDVDFAKKYFECDTAEAIFITADRIIATPSSVDEVEEPERRLSLASLIHSTIGSIRASLPL